MKKLLKSIFAPERSSNDRIARYIALGDSMSIDDYPGEGKGAASLLFKNVDHLYPEFSGKDLFSTHPAITFENLAQDGATTRDVLNEQLPALGKGSREKTILTLTAGGNDILGLQASAEEVLERLNAILDRLQEMFPDNLTIIGTIYDPTDGVGDLFGEEIREKEMKIAREINRGIRGFSTRNFVRVAEIHKHFLGHGGHCKDPSNPYFHPEDPSLWYVLTIEPNSRGAHEIRRLFWMALQREDEL